MTAAPPGPYLPSYTGRALPVVECQLVNAAGEVTAPSEELREGSATRKGTLEDPRIAAIFPVEFEPVVTRKINCGKDGDRGFLNPNPPKEGVGLAS